jgi:hypothetical protein
MYRGSPIFYSLGNFAIEQPHVWDPRITETDSFKHLQSLNPSWSLDRAYTLPPDTRWSGIALLELDGPVTRVAFRPAWIQDDSAPLVLSPADTRFRVVADFLREANSAANLNSAIEVEGNQLRITAGPAA